MYQPHNIMCVRHNKTPVFWKARRLFSHELLLVVHFLLLLLKWRNCPTVYLIFVLQFRLPLQGWCQWSASAKQARGSQNLNFTIYNLNSLALQASKAPTTIWCQDYELKCGGKIWWRRNYLETKSSCIWKLYRGHVVGINDRSTLDRCCLCVWEPWAVRQRKRRSATARMRTMGRAVVCQYYTAPHQEGTW